MRLANHGRVAIGGGLLLSGIQARVHDTVGAVGGVAKGSRTARDGTYTSHGSTSAITATGWPVLMLASCGLGLYQSSAQPGLKPLGRSRLARGLGETRVLHRSYLTILRQIDFQGFCVVFKAKRSHSKQDVLPVDGLAFFLLAFLGRCGQSTTLSDLERTYTHQMISLTFAGDE